MKALCTPSDHTAVAYASSFGGIYVTQDGGESWTEMSSPPEVNLAIKDMVVLHGSPDRLIALTYTQGIVALYLNWQRAEPAADVAFLR